MGPSGPTAGVDDAQPESIKTEGTATREQRVGIRELRSRLSEYLGEVRAGTTIVVTDHGRQVARIGPQLDSSEETLADARSAEERVDDHVERPPTEENEAERTRPRDGQRQRSGHRKPQVIFLYLDTSALVKRYVAEARSEDVMRLGADDVVPDRTGRRLPESERRQPNRITSRGE